MANKKALVIIIKVNVSSLIAALNKLITKLDRHRFSKEKRKGTFPAKRHIVSIQSSLSAPKNAPKWTIRSEHTSTSLSPSPEQSGLGI